MDRRFIGPAIIVGIVVLLDVSAGLLTDPAFGFHLIAVLVLALGALAGPDPFRALALILGPLLAGWGSFLLRFVPPSTPEVFYLYRFGIGAAIAAILLARWLGPFGFPKASRFLVRVWALVLTLILGMTGVEWAARKFIPVSPYEIRSVSGNQSIYYDHPLLGRAHTPGFKGRFVHPEYKGESVTINLQGHRDRDWPPEATPDETRVIVLGDSQTFGLGVEDQQTFPRLLERRLGGSARTLNAGISGSCTVYQLVQFEEELIHFRPDLVVVAFYTGNDLEENVAFARRLIEKGLTEKYLEIDEEYRDKIAGLSANWLEGTDCPPLNRRGYWDRASVFFRTFLDRLDLILAKAGEQGPRAVYNRQFLRALRKEVPNDVRRSVSVTRAAVAALKRAVVQNGSGIAIVIIPMKIQNEEDLFRELCRQTGQDPSTLDLERINKIVKGIAEEEGIPLLDPLPDFRSEIQGGTALYFDEGHLNREGHRLLADLIATFLREEGLAAP